MIFLMTSTKNGMSSELLSVFWQELLLVGTCLRNGSRIGDVANFEKQMFNLKTNFI